MSKQTWKELISNDFIAAGTLFNTYTTAKSVTPPGQTIDFPKNFFTLGRKLRIEIDGGISNRVTGPDTTTFQMMLGPTANIAVSTTGAMNLTVTANTLRAFKAVCEMEVQVAGATAQMMSLWTVEGIPFAAASGLANGVANTGQLLLPDPPALGTAFDATVATTLDFFAAQSVSNAGNGIQVRQYRVYLEN